jgi:hypothetical protein
MRTRTFAVAAWLLAAAAGAQAGGVVNVSFVEPAKFYDSGGNGFDRPLNLRAIELFLHELGQQHLGDGQVLDIEVLDVDLAGTIRPTRNGDQRIVRGGVDWPSFQLRYKLSAGGQTLKQGDERLAAMDYAGRIVSYREREPLRYEKEVLDRWFRARFTRH